jgi:hypothetical protein
MSNHAFKADAVLQAIRDADVGDDVVIHNEHGMVWCIIRVMSKEHLEEHNERKTFLWMRNIFGNRWRVCDGCLRFNKFKPKKTGKQGVR